MGHHISMCLRCRQAGLTPHNGPMTSYEGSASVAEPDHPTAPRVSYLVARLDRLLRLWLADVLAPFEVSLPEYTAMSILGRRPGSPTPSSLAGPT